jgi:hypothetical protein
MDDRCGHAASIRQCHSSALIGEPLALAQVAQLTGCPNPQLCLRPDESVWIV